MSKLTAIIKQYNTYEKLSEFITKPPYNLEFREDKPISDLFLICPTDTSDFKSELVKECNGIILNKNTLEIVAYGLDYVLNIDQFEELYDYPTICWDNIDFHRCLDGTLIKVYYFDSKWNISTNKCINSNKSRWASSKSFYSLFNECNIDLNELDTNNCYCYILQHPESRIVVPIPKPSATLIGYRNMNSLEFTHNNLYDNDMPTSDKISYIKNQPYSSGSYIASLPNNVSVRIDCAEYNYVKSVRTNEPNIILRYIQLINNNEYKNALYHYFPEYLSQFNIINQDIDNLSKVIQNIYYQKHVKKQNIISHTKFHRTLTQLHAQFLNHKQIINKTVVYMKLIQLPAHVLYWLLY